MAERIPSGDKGRASKNLGVVVLNFVTALTIPDRVAQKQGEGAQPGQEREQGEGVQPGQEREQKIVACYNPERMLAILMLWMKVREHIIELDCIVRIALLVMNAFMELTHTSGVFKGATQESVDATREKILGIASKLKVKDDAKREEVGNDKQGKLVVCATEQQAGMLKLDKGLLKSVKGIMEDMVAALRGGKVKSTLPKAQEKQNPSSKSSQQGMYRAMTQARGRPHNLNIGQGQDQTLNTTESAQGGSEKEMGDGRSAAESPQPSGPRKRDPDTTEQSPSVPS